MFLNIFKASISTRGTICFDEINKSYNSTVSIKWRLARMQKTSQFPTKYLMGFYHGDIYVTLE